MKLYRLQSNKLEELHGIGDGKKAADYEKTIQIMIEKNLNKVFPGLEFFVSEYPIDDSRPDTIAFSEESRSFVVIEYKNMKNKGVIDQGMSYRQLLREKKEKFVLLYQELKKKQCTVDDINWEESRVILISPHFTPHQKRASRSPELRSLIELYEIKQYEDNIVSLDRLELQPDKQKKESPQERSVYEQYTDDEYLNGKYDTNLKPTPETRQLWNKLKDQILATFEKLEFKQRKHYAGFYSKDDRSVICTIQALNTKINLNYSITTDKKLLQPSEFVTDVSSKGQWGIGHYRSEIKNTRDIESALPLIEKVYRYKVKDPITISKTFNSSYAIEKKE